MMKLTEKGKALVAKNGGILKIQSTHQGNFDYSEYDSWDTIHDVWAEECGGWDYYEGQPKDSDGEEVYTAEESRARLEEEFSAAEFETSIEEILANGDEYGIGIEFGYIENVED